MIFAALCFQTHSSMNLNKRGCGFFGSADGCCVEFRLASCGQDSQLKIWIVSQREGAGRPTPLPQLPHLSAPSLDCRAGETGRESVLTASTLKPLCRIEEFY